MTGGCWLTGGSWMTGGCWMTGGGWGAHPANNIAATTGNRSRIAFPLGFRVTAPDGILAALSPHARCRHRCATDEAQRHHESSFRQSIGLIQRCGTIVVGL
jgi:hypothetical protein